MSKQKNNDMMKPDKWKPVWMQTVCCGAAIRWIL